jgi:rod shape-determining protein MreB
LAAGLGSGLDFEDERARLVVDIGGGTTNLAIIGSGGVVASASLTAAGNAMDEEIREYIRSRYCMQIGECTAETVKKELGALTEDGKDQSMEVVGKHLVDGSAQAVEVDASEIRESLQPILFEIINGVRGIIEEAQPEAIADIYHSGIILTGGGALMKGLAERMQSELKLHVAVAEDPITTVARGAGKLLSQPERLHRASIRQNLPVWEGSEELVVSW